MQVKTRIKSLIMVMPYNLQRLLPEALAVLRFLRTRAAASAEELEAGTGLSNRAVGRAIRRLVNFDQIEMHDRAYHLTTDGKITAHQLAEYEATPTAESGASETASSVIIRRLAVVLPRAFAANVPTAMYIGVNAAQAGSPQLPLAAQLELQVSAVGGTLSTYRLSLEVPPIKAASPARISLTPAEPGRSVRVQIDAVQVTGEHSEPLGGMYFDVKVPLTTDSLDTSMRAVGMNLWLKAPPISS
jgi:hypothetical protein